MTERNVNTNTDNPPDELLFPCKPGKKPDYGTNNTLELLERIPSQMVELKLDQVLTAVKTVDNLCDFPRCKTKTSLMGQNCELCSKRFCFKHGLPEVHGCGEAVKKDERKKFLQPKPLKTIRQEQEVTQAKKRLHSKLKDMQVARMQKTGGGGVGENKNHCSKNRIINKQKTAVYDFFNSTKNCLVLVFLIVRRMLRCLDFKKFYALNISRYVSYIQGQEPEPRIREYFYYIDHEGMLFLDDAKMKNFTSCFKEKKFLKFFFSRLKFNDTNRYKAEFPYISLCGRERNFIRCDDAPIVFTHVLQDQQGNDRLSYAHGGETLTTDFMPHKIYMNPTTGRVYHPAWEKVGNIGLIRSKLAIEFSKSFEFANGEDKAPTHFIWREQKHHLDNNWVEKTKTFGMFAADN